jgi:enoyl-CoA hydratase/carnithine racemase
MLEKTLRYQKINHLVAIYLNGTPHGPMWKARMLAELNELYDEIAWDEEIWVVMIGDPGERPLSEETDLIKAVSMGHFEEETTFESLTEPISRLDCPVIAAISNDAVGQGLELALACDIRIASETACFGLPQMKTGHLPWDGGTQRLSRLVGGSKALEMILTGETIDAQEALRIGLVHKVVQKEELMKVALKMAQEMASKGPIALRYAKEAIYKGMDMTLEQGLRLEADLYLLIHTTRDRIEGIQAFREKKTPKFEGK